VLVELDSELIFNLRDRVLLPWGFDKMMAHVRRIPDAGIVIDPAVLECATVDQPTISQWAGRLGALPINLDANVLVKVSSGSEAASEDILLAITRHQAGDWGELSEEDRTTNDQALIQGDRILSAYRSARGVKFWVISEASREVTTVLLPEDY